MHCDHIYKFAVNDITKWREEVRREMIMTFKALRKEK